MKCVFAALACTAAIASNGTVALAHAQLVKATPAAEAVLSSPPSDVALQFSERLESSFSSVAVRDASGEKIDKGDARVDAGDPKILRVSLPALKLGTYKVEWRAVATDLHKIQGSYTFRVNTKN
jgi:copper resistance protein C